ncbi:MAG: glycosyltransferase family 39 protein [Cytophagaceae bacterium]|nr:glycosyltransferase family 39 protein [Cytophagaceae bacterium]MDW8455828.1 glycosyltransferase family 39 protein [Cytophagaceae bacterium]
MLRLIRTYADFLNRKSYSFYFIVFLFLLVPALLINIGAMPLIADEPTRALVSLEMILRKNYIVPTINGDPYYNKPPLYNWIVAALYNIFGSQKEWVIRIPTLLGLFIYSLIIYFFVKKKIGKREAMLTVALYVASGRILFYDSFLGLIDTLFSAFIFLNFMIIHNYFSKGKYWQMFFLSYFITAVCFMLKGLPAIVFQGITLVVMLVYEKKINLVWSLQHVCAIVFFFLLLSCYYIPYSYHNGIDTLFKTLISESTKRTVAEKGVVESLWHLITFPFEFIFHFLPSTLLVIFLINSETIRTIKEHNFLAYCSLIFLANFLVYWLSPETVPRYLFMFLPLFYMVCLHFYDKDVQNKDSKLYNTFRRFLVVVSFMLSFSMLIPLFIQLPITNGEKIFYSLMLFLCSLTASVSQMVAKRHTLMLFLISLLIARIAMNVFIFPWRIHNDPDQTFKDAALRVAEITKGQPLYLDEYAPVNHAQSFYITRERQEVLYKERGEWKSGVFYITMRTPDSTCRLYYTFKSNWNNVDLYLVKKL